MTMSQDSAIARGESPRLAPLATNVGDRGLVQVAHREIGPMAQQVAGQRCADVAEPDEADPGVGQTRFSGTRDACRWSRASRLTGSARDRTSKKNRRHPKGFLARARCLCGGNSAHLHSSLASVAEFQYKQIQSRGPSGSSRAGEPGQVTSATPGESSMVANAQARLEAADGGVGTIAQRWYVLIVMVLVYTLSIADRYVISTVLEPIRLELQLTDSGIAFLTGVSLALFYVVLGFPDLLAHRPRQPAQHHRVVPDRLVGDDGVLRSVAHLLATVARRASASAWAKPAARRAPTRSSRTISRRRADRWRSRSFRSARRSARGSARTSPA